MINISGSYSIGGKSHRNLAAQVEENTKDIKYLLDNGVLPEGTKNIEENGEYEVKKYANVNVQVPIGIFPTGTKLITTNGNFNIEEFANVFVNVAGGTEPIGTINITENGEYNVRDYETANVQVPQRSPQFDEKTNLSINIVNNSSEEKTFNGITYLTYILSSDRISYTSSESITVPNGITTEMIQIGTSISTNFNVKYGFYIHAPLTSISDFVNCEAKYQVGGDSTYIIINDPESAVSLTVTLN